MRYSQGQNSTFFATLPQGGLVNGNTFFQTLPPTT